MSAQSGQTGPLGNLRKCLVDIILIYKGLVRSCPTCTKTGAAPLTSS